MQQTSPSTFNAKAFLSEAERGLLGLYNAYVVTKSPNRQAQLAEYRRAAWYYKGVQWLVRAVHRGEPTWIPATSETATVAAYGEEAHGAVSYTLNLMTQDVDIVASIMARVSPKAAVVDDDPRRQVPAAVRETIDRILALFDALYNTTATKLPLARWAVLCPGGLFAMVRPVADPGRFGWTDEPVYEEIEITTAAESRCANCGWQGAQAELCPGCGWEINPEFDLPATVQKQTRQTGTTRVPNIGIDVVFRNVSTTYLSPGARSLDDATHLVDLDTMPVGRVLQQFKHAREMAGVRPEMSSDYSSALDGSSLQNELLSTVGPTASAEQRKVEVVRLWLDPAEYVHVAPTELQAKLNQYYPRGCRTTWIKGKLVEITPSDFRDEVAMVTHDGQPPDTTPSRFRPYMDGQTIVNDLYNLAVETVATSTPVTFLPSNLIDANMLNGQRDMPSRYVPVVPGLLSTDKPYTTQPGTLDGAIVSFIASVIGRMREAVGITEMIRGTGDPETARAAAIGREQSLQAFQAPYQQLLRLYVRAMELFIMQIVKYRFSRIWVPRSAGKPPAPVELWDLGRVAATSWRLQVDETLPMTRPDQKQHLSEMMNRVAAIPAAAEALGFSYAGNATILAELMGMAGWSSATADASKVIMGVFDSILETPLPPAVLELGPSPTDKEQERDWMRAVMDVLKDEPSLVMLSPDHIPLEMVVQEGSRLLNVSDTYRAVYRTNFPGWLRCAKYLSTARQMLAAQTAQQAAAGQIPGMAPPSPSNQKPSGQPPDGTQILPPLAN